MSIEVELPSLGESVFEGTPARWLVADGEIVEVDQAIVEVTTDKVDAEIPALRIGRIEFAWPRVAGFGWCWPKLILRRVGR